jgi:uncharacterized protein involved in outer membrane biogenesis
MLHRKKLFLWLIGIAGVLALLLVILIPRIIDSRLVIKKIQHEVLQKFDGNLTFQDIDFSFFPNPHLTLHRVRLSIAGKAEGRMKSLILYPQILPLLKGEVKVRDVHADSPDFTVMLPDKKGLEEVSYKRIMEKVKSGLDSVVKKMPGLAVEVNKGRLELLEEKQSVFMFADIQARAGLQRGKLEIGITCGSNLWKNIKMKLQVNQKGFESVGEIDIEHFRPHVLTNYFLTNPSVSAADSSMDAGIHLKTAGVTVLHADIEGSELSLIVFRKNNRREIKGNNLKGTILIDDVKTIIGITQLYLENPKLDISGRLLLDKLSPRATLSLEGKRVDVNSTRRAALAIAADVKIVRDISNIVRGGTVPLINLSMDGKSLQDPGATENISLKGRLQSGRIFVPGPALDLENVSGDAVVSKGILEGKNVQCSMGNIRGREGSIRIGLKGKNAPLHVETTARMNLLELPPILKRFIKNESLIREIGYVQDLKGSAEGKLILGERLDKVNTAVHVQDMNFSARYRYLPDILEVKGGQFTYDEKGAGIENLSGRVGSSSISGLTAKLSFLKPAHIEIISGKSMVYLQEIYPWLLSFEKLNQELRDFKNIKGILSLDDIKLKGPLLEPRQWSFNMKGNVENLSIDSGLLPGLLGLKSGEFEISPKRLSFSNIQAEILDASLQVSGMLQDYLKAIDTIDLTFHGRVGHESNRWITKRLSLPSLLDVHSPVFISNGHLLWNRGLKTSFQGDLKINNDPNVSLDVLHTPEELIIHKASIQDKESHALLTAHIRARDLRFSFQGDLKQKTVDKIFLNPYFSKEWIRGDFRVSIPVDLPAQFTAHGNLEGENILIPWDAETPLMIKSISLNALNNKILIKSSDVTWGDHQFSLKGDAGFSERKLFVDIDVSANKLNLETVRKTFTGKTKAIAPGKTSQQKLPVNGKIRLKAEEVQYDRFTLSPIHADILLSDDEIQATITGSTICGISTTGNVNITDQDVKLNVKMTAHNQELEPAILCLTDKKTDITGTFDFKGQISGQGKGDSFTDSIQGDIELIARNGNIYKSRTLDKTFDLLNKTETFREEFPDLDKKALKYKSIHIKGAIQKQRLEIREGVLDTAITEVVAQGHVDLKNDSIDLNALVAPVKFVHRAIKKIPALGYILGGNLVSVPVKVTGTIANPEVTFFSPSAIGSELLGIIKRTFNMPVKLIEPLIPEEKK